MIELPESYVLTKQINETLVGKTIKKATANQSPHKFAWYSGDPDNYDNLLAGKTIQGASTVGDHVEIKAENMILHISTPLRYHVAGQKLPAKHQLLLEFTDGTALSATIQMWGCLYCFKEGRDFSIPYYEENKDKPSALSEDFDKAYFDSLFDEKSSKLSAKAFLATEQRIPGLGNGVLQDILWNAGIHPKRKMPSLSEKEISTMYDSVKSVLKQMTIKGGRDTEKDLFGNPGGYKTVLCKDTVDTPCPKCGTIIKKEAYMGGSIYYCEGCQKL
ncbi:MAG: DNA-formamidopyrimidine glycosylase family protein [Bacillota bacterium]